jgi:hypothetical protein
MLSTLPDGFPTPSLIHYPFCVLMSSLSVPPPVLFVSNCLSLRRAWNRRAREMERRAAEPHKFAPVRQPTSNSSEVIAVHMYYMLGHAWFPLAAATI